MLVLIADADGGGTLKIGKHLLVRLRHESHVRRPVEADQGAVHLVAGDGAERTTDLVQHDPCTGFRRELAVRLSNASLDIRLDVYLDIDRRGEELPGRDL